MRRSANFLLCVALCASLGVAAQDAPAASSAPTRIAVHAARLLDVDSGRIVADPMVLVEGDRIASVAAGGRAPDGVQVLELGDVTLLPGLIDVHVHLGNDPTTGTGDYYKDMFTLGPMDTAVLAPTLARRTLDAGFTTVRNLGSGDFLDVALRNAIDRGLIEGPRILAATWALGATGGHADGSTGLAPGVEFTGGSGVVDGVDAVRAKVRDNVKHGADVIKFMASAGVISNEASVGAPQYSQAEMDAIVDEAHRWGKKVAAHAHGAEAIRMAILAGVDSVEHCSFIDDAGLKLRSSAAPSSISTSTTTITSCPNTPSWACRKTRSTRRSWSGGCSARTSARRCRPERAWPSPPMPACIRTAGTRSSSPRKWSGA